MTLIFNILAADTDSNYDKLPPSMYKITTYSLVTTKTPAGVKRYVMYLLEVDTNRLMKKPTNQEVQVECLKVTQLVRG